MYVRNNIFALVYEENVVYVYDNNTFVFLVVKHAWIAK